ncbi:MAG: GNAT family N-acetyltransferase [Deltaproteobacteria bacterium]|nr:GNAT family N-acetyltransferase [Deltaproteobacteria bacterium]
MEIAQASMQDLPEVMDVISACVWQMESQGIFQWDEIYPNSGTLQKDIESHFLYVARDDGRVFGIMALNEYQDPEYSAIEWEYGGGKILAVHRLAVDPLRWRQGIASRLMDFAEQHAGARGYAAIRLDAFLHNPGSVALYDRRGYRNAGIVRFRKGLFYCFEREALASR